MKRERGALAIGVVALAALFSWHQATISSLVDEIAEGRHAADGAEADVTLLFLDVRGFTAYSDGRDPGEVVARLNALWDRVVPVITNHHGRANKFVGDGLKPVTPSCSPTPHVRA
ncbi:MAG TPA: adenylate/guanylate cyclase domain-containing protein [Acidimicrobiales bacterium]|nr:adenylate/guanylate cyclase domain-containing protein [Acidimicrobiales bacterium]